MDVPAPRVVSGTPACRQVSMTAITSEGSRGRTTDCGITRYSDASVLYSERASTESSTSATPLRRNCAVTSPVHSPCSTAVTVCVSPNIVVLSTIMRCRPPQPSVQFATTSCSRTCTTLVGDDHLVNHGSSMCNRQAEGGACVYMSMTTMRGDCVPETL